MAAQTILPSEILVIWQQDDEVTRDLIASLGAKFDGRLKLVYSPQLGIVPALNMGLRNALGKVVLLIDDDAVAPREWLQNHLRHYDDERIGAVGGPALNHVPDGGRFPVLQVRQCGQLRWYGKIVGNLNDSVPRGTDRSECPVDSLAGNNMSLRRSAFDQFDDNLRDYWQYFELEACQQVKQGGYRIVFDFNTPVLHYPASTNKVYDGSRDGDLTQKYLNAAYNHAYTLSKHSGGLLRPMRLFYLVLIGSIPYPGPLKYPFAVLRYRHPLRELRVLGLTLRGHWRGWLNGGYQRDMARG